MSRLDPMLLPVLAAWFGCVSPAAQDFDLVRHISIDVTAAPELSKWAERARTLGEIELPFIADWIDTKRKKLPEDVVLVFTPKYDGVAATSGHTITISSKYVAGHPDDFGMVIHELTHVVQGYPSYDPSWLVEGIADWVRYYNFERGKRFFTVRAGKSDYRQGYGVAARFLDWASTRYTVRLVPTLSRSMQDSTYRPTLWKKLTGHDLDALWSLFVKQTDWTIGPFTRETRGPILRPDPNSSFADPIARTSVAWESAHVFNPAAAGRFGKVFLFYRAEGEPSAAIGQHTSRIGLAVSRDGVHFNRRSTPVLYPADDLNAKLEWPGGCEDPRIVKSPTGEFVMTYTAWDRKIARLCVATSPDLRHWTKHGPAFAKAAAGRYRNTWSKSGSIVTTPAAETLVASMIGGKYWMYWGEGEVKVATSTNLVDWTPLTTKSGDFQVALAPRKGRFDGALVEPGPPAVLTSEGIVLLYNGKSLDAPGLPAGAYSAGQAVFDSASPWRARDRLESPFLHPQDANETAGQYAVGTTFIEGLVWFHGRWRLYYGAADSTIGVAVAKGK